MSENTTPQYTPGGSPAGTYTTPAPIPLPEHMQRPAPKKQAWWKKPAVLLPVGALLLGTAIGTANTPKPVEVVKEVPGPERVVEKEKRVEVPVTPASCMTALDLNEEAFSGLAKSMSLVTEGDYSGAKANNETVARLVPKVNAAKAECRASAK